MELKPSFIPFHVGEENVQQVKQYHKFPGNDSSDKWREDRSQRNKHNQRPYEISTLQEEKTNVSIVPLKLW